MSEYNKIRKLIKNIFNQCKQIVIKQGFLYFINLVALHSITMLSIILISEWIENNIPQVKEVGIEDDTFAGNIKRVHEFCEEIIKRKIKLKWYTNVRVGLKLETLKLIEIKDKYPFAIIKFKDKNFNFEKNFKCGEATINIIKPNWIQNL